MSTSLSNAQATLEMPPSILPGCFLNVGWKSSFFTIDSCRSRMKSAPLPSGGWKSCRPATCIGCSRDSPMRNMESVGEISFIDVTVPFLTGGDDDEHNWQGGRQGRIHHGCGT